MRNSTKRRSASNPNVWYIQKKSSGGYSYPYNAQGLVMTREEWEAVRAHVDAFYAAQPDPEISAHNKQKAADRLRQKVEAREARPQ